MSLINQMLRDIEERKDDPIKGQNGIISQPDNGSTSVRKSHTLLILLATILLVEIIYLRWYPHTKPINRQPTEVTSAKTIKALPAAPTVEGSELTSPKLASSDQATSEPDNSGVVTTGVEDPSIATPDAANPEVMETEMMEAEMLEPGVVTPLTIATLLSQSEKPDPADQLAPGNSSDAKISIRAISPKELMGSWQRQKLTITGNNFTRKSEILLCWPGKCITLKSERISYISPKTLQILISTGITQQRWQVTVRNPQGQSSNTQVFDIIAPPPAKIIAPSLATISSNNIANSDQISKQLIPLTPYQQAEEYYLKGSRLNSEQKKGQAITLWKRALQVAPEHHASRQILIETFISSGRTIEAGRYIQAAIKLFPKHPLYIEQQARLYIAAGNNPDAVAIIEDAINRDVANAELYALLAALYQRNKSTVKSIAHYKRALALKPTQGVWWMGLGISLEQNSQYRDAIAAFQKAQGSGTLSYKLTTYVDEQITKNRQKLDAE